MNKRATYQDLGLIDYKKAWDYQKKLFAGLVEQKILKRNGSDPLMNRAGNFLLFCEHPHVYTLGKNGSEKNLLADGAKLAKEKVMFYKIDRGGDVTYHGPGQIVGYPVLDLEDFGVQIRGYIFRLEEAIIRTLEKYGIPGKRMKEMTGIWIDSEIRDWPKKICAIGIKASRFVTMHGFALNVNTELDYFDMINPCGITDKGVTSMERELGYSPDLQEVKNNLRESFSEVFEMEMEDKSFRLDNP